jgi:uncharacterized protein YcfJ
MLDKSMIKGLVVVAVALTAAGAVAGYQAVDGKRSAHVLDVKPLTRVARVPREVCSDVLVSHRAPTNDPKRVTGAVLGAVAGGVLGNQIGDGNGQTVATVAGAAAGGYAGSKIQKHMQDEKRTQTLEQRCRTAYDFVEKPNGYEVRYRLGDREGIVRTDHAPGRTIPVRDGELVLGDLNDRA